MLQLHPLELREGTRVLDLTGRQLRVLAMLVEAEGQIVSKQAFFDRIWHGLTVEDGNLTQTIFLLRRTLGQFEDGEEYIQTVPRKGYRLASKALQPEANDQLAVLNGRARLTQDGHPFRMLVNSVEDYAIFMLDCAGRVVTWNPGAEAILGYSQQEVLGQHFSAFFVAEESDVEAPGKRLATAAREGRWAGEGWRLRKNGARFWAHSILIAMRDSAGHLMGFGEVLRDLTESKRAEDALRRMETTLRKERDRLRAAAESSRDALYICEALRSPQGEVEDFVFTYLNSNVSKMVAIPAERLLGGKMCELLPANLSLGLFEAYKRVLLTGERFVTEFRIQDPTVTCDWIRVQAVRLDDGVAITASDISEQKRSQRQLSNLTDTGRAIGPAPQDTASEERLQI